MSAVASGETGHGAQGHLSILVAGLKAGGVVVNRPYKRGRARAIAGGATQRRAQPRALARRERAAARQFHLQLYPAAATAIRKDAATTLWDGLRPLKGRCIMGNG
ncbi:MAG: hypothetical protein ACJAVS_000778 [Paracoccaceae bacterium]|jgi:hypothetical protein